MGRVFDYETPAEEERRLRYNLRARVSRNRKRYERLNSQLQALTKTTEKAYAAWARADEELYAFEKEREQA